MDPLPFHEILERLGEAHESEVARLHGELAKAHAQLCKLRHREKSRRDSGNSSAWDADGAHSADGRWSPQGSSRRDSPCSLVESEFREQPSPRRRKSTFLWGLFGGERESPPLAGGGPRFDVDPGTPAAAESLYKDVPARDNCSVDSDDVEEILQHPPRMRGSGDSLSIHMAGKLKCVRADELDMLAVAPTAQRGSGSQPVGCAGAQGSRNQKRARRLTPANPFAVPAPADEDSTSESLCPSPPARPVRTGSAGSSDGGDGSVELEKETSRSLNISSYDDSMRGSVTVYTTECFQPRRKTNGAAMSSVSLNEVWNQIAVEFEEEGGQTPFTQLESLERARSFVSTTQKDAGPRVLFDRLIVSPGSAKRKVWDMMAMFFLCYDAIVVPLQVFYAEEDTPFLAVGRYATTIFWSFDIFSSFFVGFYSKGTVEMRAEQVAVHYLKSWFSVDLVLVISDWIVLMFGFSSKTSAIRIGKISRGMRALRLVRLMKIHLLLSDFALRLRSEQWRTCFYIMKLLSLVVIINHFLACGFYGLSRIGNQTTWANRSFDDSSPTSYKYWTSLHWSLTQFTPASMEVVPANTLERVYTVCVLLFALVTFSSFISSITTAMTNLRNINAHNIKEEQTLRRYLAEHQISSGLTSRVLHYFQDRTQESSVVARAKEEDIEMFKVLPESLKHELRCQHYMPLLMGHPLFPSYMLHDASAVQEICSLALSERRLIIRDELYGRGMAVTHVVFNIVGVLAYRYPVHAINTVTHIMKGHWACELALWVDKTHMYGPLTAETNCEIAMLEVTKFRTITQAHPESAGVLASYGKKYVEEVNRVMSNCRWQGILCNEADIVQGIADRSFAAVPSARDVSVSYCYPGGGEGSLLNMLIDGVRKRSTTGSDDAGATPKRHSKRKSTSEEDGKASCKGLRMSSKASCNFLVPGKQ